MKISLVVLSLFLVLSIAVYSFAEENAVSKTSDFNSVFQEQQKSMDDRILEYLYRECNSTGKKRDELEDKRKELEIKKSDLKLRIIELNSKLPVWWEDNEKSFKEKEDYRWKLCFK
jgi:septal ring factor EnvC (AmiA/AmiB activator)